MREKKEKNKGHAAEKRRQLKQKEEAKGDPLSRRPEKLGQCEEHAREDGNTKEKIFAGIRRENERKEGSEMNWRLSKKVCSRVQEREQVNWMEKGENKTKGEKGILKRDPIFLQRSIRTSQNGRKWRWRFI